MVVRTGQRAREVRDAARIERAVRRARLPGVRGAKVRSSASASTLATPRSPARRSRLPTRFGYFLLDDRRAIRRVAAPARSCIRRTTTSSISAGSHAPAATRGRSARPVNISGVRFSPDGRRVAVQPCSGRGRWTSGRPTSIARSRQRLTSRPELGKPGAVGMPDGRSLFFDADARRSTADFSEELGDRRGEIGAGAERDVAGVAGCIAGRADVAVHATGGGRIRHLASRARWLGPAARRSP